MVTFDASMQRFAQGRLRRAYLPMGQPSKLARISLAVDQGSDNRPAASNGEQHDACS